MEETPGQQHTNLDFLQRSHHEYNSLFAATALSIPSFLDMASSASTWLNAADSCTKMQSETSWWGDYACWGVRQSRCVVVRSFGSAT